MPSFLKAVKGTKGGSLISIEVSPKASANAIAGFNEWRGTVEIRVAAEAREGEANRELLRFLSDILEIPSENISINSGARSSRKTIAIKGLPPDECARRLEAAHGRR
ncbi:MAG: YggU family protein [Euryarchaeota archaeon]|nr:YggU family protein [Euryarchaeota archaeon]